MTRKLSSFCGWFACSATLLLAIDGLPISAQQKAVAPAETSNVVDNLPQSAIRRLGTTRLRHGSQILALAYSPNGRILAAGGGDDPVRLWDPDTGNEIRTITAREATAEREARWLGVWRAVRLF